MYCPECGNQNREGANFCHFCGKALAEIHIAAPAPKPVTLRLGWHKFMIYFSLFAGALLNFTQGIQFMTGIMYGDMKDEIYAFYSGLEALNVIYGLLLIGIAVFCIYVRFQLAGFKRGAPRLLAILYGCTCLLPIAYLGVYDAVTGIGADYSSVIGTMLGSLAMAGINIVYYNRRRDLFVH